MTNEEMRMVFDAAQALVALIKNASEDEVEELEDYVDDGFPIGIDVAFGDAGTIEKVDVDLGHGDGFEWHGTGYALDHLRAKPANTLLMMMTDHVEIAIENHRDCLAA